MCCDGRDFRQEDANFFLRLLVPGPYELQTTYTE